MAYSTVYGLELISFLAQQSKPASIREIIESTGIARATTYRALDELTKAGYVSVLGNPRRYAPTWRVGQLGIAMLANNHVREVTLSNVFGLAAALSRNDAP